MGAFENPILSQSDIFNKYLSALQLLCCRALGEPYNFSHIDEHLTKEMCGGDYFGIVLIEAQRQFRLEGRYSNFSISAKTGFDSATLYNSAQSDAEIDLFAAWSLFQDIYGQYVELQIADSVRTWINKGDSSAQIKINGDAIRKEKGIASRVINNDGKAEFQRELINAIDCKVFEYPVNPPLDSFRQVVPFFEPGEYIVVAGRTGMGKSFYALNCNYQCALDNVPSCYINLENTPKNVQRRLWQMHSGIKWQQQYPNIPDTQIKHMGDAWEWVSNSKIKSYTTGRNLQTVLNTIRTDFYENGCQLVVVDYLQKISDNSFKGNRVDQLANISAELRQLASDLKIPIIALAQINREAEKSADKRPSIADIRSCGDIEQDASMILLLYRPEYYEITVDENSIPYPKNYADIFIGKGRDVERAKIQCRFNEVRGFHDTPIFAPAPIDYTVPNNRSEDLPF